METAGGGLQRGGQRPGYSISGCWCLPSQLCRFPAIRLCGSQQRWIDGASVDAAGIASTRAPLRGPFASIGRGQDPGFFTSISFEWQQCN